MNESKWEFHYIYLSTNLYLSSYMHIILFVFCPTTTVDILVYIFGRIQILIKYFL